MTERKQYPLNESRYFAIWETICYHGVDGLEFTTRTIEQSLIQHDKFKPKTASLYFNRFVKWALDNPEEFSGPRSKLVRVRHGRYVLEDNPER